MVFIFALIGCVFDEYFDWLSISIFNRICILLMSLQIYLSTGLIAVRLDIYSSTSRLKRVYLIFKEASEEWNETSKVFMFCFQDFVLIFNSLMNFNTTFQISVSSLFMVL